jgi:hypothetical protein
LRRFSRIVGGRVGSFPTVGPLSADEGKHVAHNTSGLPKLDLEPFDPSDLYAAARSGTGAEAGRQRSRRAPLLVGLGALVSLVVVGMAVLLS